MSPPRRLAARFVWTPTGVQRDACVVVDAHGAIVRVTQANGDDDLLDGILMPGLVNAHAHLELSQLRHKVPGGQGSVPWVRSLWATGLPPSPDANDAAAREAAASGTRWLIDTTNRGDTDRHLRAAGLQGIVQIECLGLTEGRWQAVLDAARRRTGSRQVRIRPTAHSPVSCSPALLSTALTGPWPTIHVDEDPADLDLLRDRTGPWAAFHEQLGHDWRGRLGQAPSGLALLDQLGLLRRELGLVHLCAARDRDLVRVAKAGSTVILCPRSNLHIGGTLPNVARMAQLGIPLAIGTDSLGSTPDMDIVAEAATLHGAFPELDPALWMQALTSGGGALLGNAGAGQLRAGTFPGVLHLALPADTDDPLPTLLDGTRWPREFLA
mgnify:CR=1 FL=1